MSEGMKRLNVSPDRKNNAARATGWVAGLTTALNAASAQAAGDLVLIPDPGLLLTMVIAFTLLIFPLNALLFKPIFRALDAREERIQGARDRSVKLQQDADEVLGRYETAIREARAESETARQAKLEQAREEQTRLTTAAKASAEADLERARGELSQTIESARTSLRASADELARSAAETVLGRAI